MQSRRSMFQFFFLSAAAALPGVAFARRAFGGSELPEFYSGTFDTDTFSTDFLDTPALDVVEEWIDIQIDGEMHHVHRVQMTVRDRTGNIAILFDIPENRPIAISSGDPATPGGNIPGFVKDGRLTKQRRVILPLFEYDSKAEVIVGEPGKTTIEERLGQVIDATRQSGFDVSPPFQNGHTIWITQDGPGFKYPKHALAHLPWDVTLDDMTVIVPLHMVKHNRV